MKQVRPPMLVCEPVLTEVVYFLREDDLNGAAGTGEFVNNWLPVLNTFRTISLQNAGACRFGIG